jgi:hypothetical protein
VGPEIQTQKGRCETHGIVEATRQIPRIQFPFIVYGTQRWLAKRREPFRCPQCEKPVQPA